MLDTILQIGNTFRKEGRLKHHRYIKPAPISDNRTTVSYFSIKISKDMSFDTEEISQITDENLIRNKLFYHTFKTSDSDSSMKYLFGDICYGYDKSNKELGHYRMGKVSNGKYNNTSFDRGINDADYFKGTLIEAFRESFNANKVFIESFLMDQNPKNQIFLHFDFEGGRHWYEFAEELKKINDKLLDDFAKQSTNGMVMKKSLYKTIASDDDDLQFPNFSSDSMFKVKSFSETEFLDLVYAIDYSRKAKVKERNIKIIVLPKGNNITGSQIEEFFGQETSAEELDEAEGKVDAQNSLNESKSILDSLFSPVVENVAENITQFDMVFSKRADSPSTPDVDMVEVSGIKKSFLAQLADRIKFIRTPLESDRTNQFPRRPKEFLFLDVRKSFLNILGDMTKDKKKYQSHLFKVLPQIYTGTYYRDDVLLPAFIEKTEFNIRNLKAKEKSNYNLLKYDYYFLTQIQNLQGVNQMEEMQNSKSYQAGLLLGKIAQPLDRKIASFEKNYVGLLSRRIADKRDLVKFANFINEKLAIHDVAYPDLKQASTQLAKLLAGISDKEYMKNYCAFGFFESYFKPWTKEPASSEANS